MKHQLYLYFLFFLFFVSSLYIDFTFPRRLKETINWKPNSIDISKAVDVSVRCFTLFLGGLLIITSVSVRKLLVTSLLCVLVAITLFEVTAIHQDGKSLNDTYFSQPFVTRVTIFTVLFGTYFSFTRFILMVLLLHTGGDDFVAYSYACYLIIFNLAVICVFGFYQYGPKYPYVTISLPIILVTFIVLFFGYREFFYKIDSLQILCRGLIYKTIRSTQQDDFTTLIKPNMEVTLLQSLGRLCIFFILLLPFGLSNSLVWEVSSGQFNNMSGMESFFRHVNDSSFWIQLIGTSTVITVLVLSGILWYYTTWFKGFNSKTIWKLIVAFIMLIISTVLVAVVEKYRETWPKGIYSDKDVSNMPVYFVIPQLVTNAIGEVILITTCGKFMYKMSGDVLKYLSAAFFLGAATNGGAGNFIAILIHYIILHTYNLTSLDITNINYKCYISSGLLLISGILLIFFSLKFEKEIVRPDSLTHDSLDLR